MDTRPIGFFDSGIGGITVLEEAVRQLPNENFIYYGDTNNAPYGDKTSEAVLHLAENAVNLLLEKGCKAIVIACNTATAAAAESLRARYAFPIIGIEPALKPASLLPGEEKIAVLATHLTLETPKFQRLFERYGKNAILLPCPGLMECVERGDLSGAAVDEILTRNLSPCAGQPIKAVVLGCTHYPYVKDAIAKHFSPGTPIIDGSLGTARQLRRRLEENGLLSPGGGGKITFLSSAQPAGEAIHKMEQMLALLRRQKEQK